jgi:hypothetical protein
MNTKVTAAIVVSLLVGLGLGFFAGQEYTKYQIVKSISEAFQTSATPNPSSEDESKEAAKVVEEKNNISVAQGSEVELATFTYVINSAEEKDMIKSSYGQPHLAGEGTKFVVVNATITNTTPETFSFDEDAFTLEDSNGDLYKPYKNTIGNIDTYLAWQELSPNIPNTGVVVFQLPVSIEAYELLAAKANTNDLYRVKLK